MAEKQTKPLTFAKTSLIKTKSVAVVLAVFARLFIGVLGIVSYLQGPGYRSRSNLPGTIIPAGSSQALDVSTFALDGSVAVADGNRLDITQLVKNQHGFASYPVDISATDTYSVTFELYIVAAGYDTTGMALGGDGLCMSLGAGHGLGALGGGAGENGVTEGVAVCFDEYPVAGTWDIDSCTYVKPDGQLSMPAAEIACIRMGGHLASIHSDAANDAVMDAGGADAYIGFHDLFLETGCIGDGNSADDHDTGFVWTDGTAVDYTNWAGGEPNDWNGSAAGGANCDAATDGAGGEDCTHMRGDGLWNDAGCGGGRSYICEMCGTPAIPTSFSRPDGALPMSAAEIACIRMGGHLASIHSDADNQAVMDAGGADAYTGFHDMLEEAGCTGDGNSADDHNTGFIWTDGTFVDYTNWAGGEPNDWDGSTAGGANCGQATDGAGGEDCTCMRGDGLWNDMACGDFRGYVCGFAGALPMAKSHHEKGFYIYYNGAEIYADASECDGDNSNSNNVECPPVSLFVTPGTSNDEVWHTVTVTIAPSEGGAQVIVDMDDSFLSMSRGVKGIADIAAYALPSLAQGGRDGGAYLSFSARTGGHVNYHSVRNIHQRDLCVDTPLGVAAMLEDMMMMNTGDIQMMTCIQSNQQSAPWLNWGQWGPPPNPSTPWIDPQNATAMRAELDIVGSIESWANDPDACKKVFFLGRDARWFPAEFDSAGNRREDDTNAISDCCRFPIAYKNCPLTCKYVLETRWETPSGDKAEAKEQNIQCFDGQQ
jgi:hypothetical protein